MSSHTDHAKRAGIATPCAAWHVNFRGGCLNCGWNPRPKVESLEPIPEVTTVDVIEDLNV